MVLYTGPVSDLLDDDALRFPSPPLPQPLPVKSRERGVQAADIDAFDTELASVGVSANGCPGAR